MEAQIRTGRPTASDGPGPLQQERGAVRRQALLDAAVKLLASDGARAVTHRAVAREAGTTHGAPRYYFATREKLLDEALRQIAERQVREVEELLRRPSPANPGVRAKRLARFIASTSSTDRDGEVARYELFLEAARRPQLRPALDAWGAAYTRLFAAELTADARDPEAEAELLLNLLNGLLLRQLATPRRDFEKGVLEPALARFTA
jgi:DNA-binding transcriptional regulator YbjK